MKPIILPLLASFAITGCATVAQKVPFANGGSRADGTVEMVYSYGKYEEPVVDWEATEATATERCERWGYDGAEAFGGQTETCTAMDNMWGGCLTTQVTIRYQCLHQEDLNR